MDRRSFIAASSLSALGASLSLSTPSDAKPISPGVPLPRSGSDRSPRLTWQEFLDQTVVAATPLAEDRSQAGQDAYLYTLAAYAARLGELPEVNPRDFGGLTPAYLLNLIYRDPESPFVILYWRMEPNAVFPAHCHPGANVCTLCTSGRAVIRNYDAAPGSPECWSGSTDEFEVIESNTEVLRPGVVNVASEQRNNIHRFEAGPQGAEGIDISRGYDEDPKPFSYMRIVDSGTNSAGEAVHTAQWVGKDLQRAV